MKMIVFGFSILLTLSGLMAQNLIQGVPYDSTLYNGYYTASPGCTQNSQMTIKLDTALYHYANGMEFMVVIDSISFAGPTYVSPVQPGDTILLNSANPVCGSPPAVGLNYWFRIVLAGTPTTANQPYPCHIGVNPCTCLCPTLYIEPSPFNTSSCRVDLANTVVESSLKRSLELFPNPANTTFSVKGIQGKNKLRLYDAFGKLVLEKEVNADAIFDVHQFPEGVYTLHIEGGPNSDQYKLIISR